MNRTVRFYLSTLVPALLFSGIFPAGALGQEFELKNEALVAHFGSRGLVFVTDQHSGLTIHLTADEFELRIGGGAIDSAQLQPAAQKGSKEVAYDYRAN